MKTASRNRTLGLALLLGATVGLLTPCLTTAQAPLYSDSGFTTSLNCGRSITPAHTSATEVGDIATQARPKLLILTHQLFFGSSDETLLAEVRSHFAGHVVPAKDLDVY